jgi:hypothetical protein
MAEKQRPKTSREKRILHSARTFTGETTSYSEGELQDSDAGGLLITNIWNGNHHNYDPNC